MKKLSKSLLLVALLAVYCLPAWSQASTQGKEFWVSSTIVCSPGGSSNQATPYIAVSAEKACTVTIQGGVGNAINITQNVASGSWSEFGNTVKPEQKNPAVGPVCVNMDASKWYPLSMTDASSVRNLADQKNMYGLHITATEDISVYVILSSPNSMDASNILPVTALGDEYYTQDYWPIVKSDFSNTVSMITILATEDGTKVDIIPNGNTYGKNNSGQLMTIDLNKGQTYYLMSEADKRLSGTHIQAKNGKKIAIFNGVPLTNLPTNIAARDCLFEQSMPIEYWGTQFIVTRSLEKNGNLIGITATVNGTTIKVDGYTKSTINAGDTYYIMLQSATDPNSKNPGTSPIDLVVTADAAYIETSCPCAVYSYDTGNSYRYDKNITEVVESKGDPSSIWVSPIQQKISKITFGTCYTNKTEDHFLNVVTETATCQQTKLTALYGATQIDKTSSLSWQPVPGNPTYSYARAKIGDSNTKQYSVFRLENPKGFIAYVYGNGNDESYAYSAGSAAVEQGIRVEEIIFVDGTRSEEKFCMGTSNKIELDFDAKVGTDEVTRVDWDFGDGVSEHHGTPQTKHTYYSPGWYDVTASVYGHQVCTDESEMLLGKVRFTFRVIRPYIKYVPNRVCQEPGSPAKPNDTADIDFQCQDTIEVLFNYYPNKSTYSFSGTYADSVFFAGKWIKTDGPVTDTIIDGNAVGCDSIVTCNIKIITSLDFRVDTTATTICSGEEADIPYSYTKGSIDQAWFEDLSDNKKKYTIPRSNLPEKAPDSGTFKLPTSTLQPGHHQLVFHITDSCVTSGQISGVPAEYTYPIDLTVYYPDSIFTYEFNNVLAVWQKGYEGGGNKNPGWDFIAYQWYRNDTLIEGATSSVYHTAEPFTLYDEYYVELTRRDGVTLRSCSQTIYAVDDFSGPEQEEPEPDSGEQPAPAAMPTKVIRNQQMHVLHDGAEYNMFGQRVR